MQPNSQNQKEWKFFFLNISMVILLFLIGLLIGVFFRNKKLVDAELLTRAQAHFHNIVLTRRWNANLGGVYVEKKGGVTSNPYLDKPDIHSTSGKTYTMKNPALMTREISEYAQEAGSYHFHITSLNPLNPHNAPDAFEKNALEGFARGEREYYLKTPENNGKISFRYMAPLYTEMACLDCHAKQGYQLGDVRGGISVQFDITSIEKALNRYLYLIIGLGVVSAGMLLGIIYFFIIRLMKKLSQAQMKIQEMAVKDELTKLFNRRYFYGKLDEEIKRGQRYRRRLSLIMLDIDFFKKINDTYGHQGGDKVLRDFARLLQSKSRHSDTVARYGGEEFIIIYPESGSQGAKTAAENIRQATELLNVEVKDGLNINLTVSIGICSLEPYDLAEVKDPGEMINATDEALYKAKQNGRNRIEVY